MKILIEIEALPAASSDATTWNLGSSISIYYFCVQPALNILYSGRNKAPALLSTLLSGYQGMLPCTIYNLGNNNNIFQMLFNLRNVMRGISLMIENAHVCLTLTFSQFTPQYSTKLVSI